MAEAVPDRGRSPRAEPVIRFEGVGLSLGGVPIYDRLDFEVGAGEFVSLLGPSGCGKSTSLRLIADLLPVQSGTVGVMGGTPAQRWDEIAFVFQSPRLAPWRDALGNVTLAAELRSPGIPRAEREARARELLALVGLAKDAHKSPAMLSGGERQRVALARALSLDPSIVLMDEPFSALDPDTRRRLREQIVELWQRTGKTIVFVTHDIDEALTVSQRILLLSNKPTRVIDEILVEEPRPRRIEESASLRAKRDSLLESFRRMGETPEI